MNGFAQCSVLLARSARALIVFFSFADF